METLTIRQAYDAMYLLLEDYFRMTKSDDIALLLSILTIIGDRTSDPAGWHDWMKCVQQVLWPDTPEHRQMLEELVSNQANYLGTDSFGSDWYARLFSDGAQIWAQVRNGEIKYGGIRNHPKPFDAKTGLTSPNSP